MQVASWPIYYHCYSYDLGVTAYGVLIREFDLLTICTHHS
jgi:hypothetical protein